MSQLNSDFAFPEFTNEITDPLRINGLAVQLLQIQPQIILRNNKPASTEDVNTDNAFEEGFNVYSTDTEFMSR